MAPVARADRLKTALFTGLALAAFAANSLLTRLALAAHLVDAATFSGVRLGSGAIVLALLARAQTGGWSWLRPGGLVGPLALFAYLIPFSFAYVRIGASVGALVLFGAVQLTMIGAGIARGERPPPLVWLGLAAAAGGLLTLALPSATRPDPGGVALMVAAGAAWGVYSLRGRSAAQPLAANARSFTLAAGPALLLALAFGHAGGAHPRGLLLAVLSGAVSSGLGYAIWYRALRGLSAVQAGIVQLSVPVLAASCAIPLLGEHPTARLAGAGAAVLGGVALAMLAPRRR